MPPFAPGPSLEEEVMRTLRRRRWPSVVTPLAPGGVGLAERTMRLHRSRTSRASAVVAGAIACAGLALPSPSFAGGFADTRFTLRFAPSFIPAVRSHCAEFYVAGIRSRGVSATVRGGFAGTLDVGDRRGEALAGGAEWQIGQPSRPWRRYATLGLELAGPKAYVTAVVTRGPVPRGKRRRIAEIRGAKIDAGLTTDSRGRAIPTTYRARISGRLALLSPMTREIGRLKCKGRRRARRVGAGSIAGQITVDVRGEQASGLAGDARITVEPGAESVVVEPTGGNTPDGQRVFTAPITSGLPIPLVCAFGLQCYPSGGTYTLGGGFDLVNGGARASVTGIVVRPAGASVQDVVHTITGSLNGSPVTIVDGGAPDGPYGWTEDFSRRVTTILGVEAYGRLGVRAQFTRTGPP